MIHKLKTTVELDVVLEYEQVTEHGQCSVLSCIVGDVNKPMSTDILGALSDADREELTTVCEDDLRELKELGEA